VVRWSGIKGEKGRYRGIQTPSKIRKKKKIKITEKD